MNEVFQSVMPGTMYFWILFIGQGPLQEIIIEKENLTLSRLLAAPVTMQQFLVSKMMRCFLLCVLVQSALLLMSGMAFGMRWGNPAPLAVVVTFSAWSMTGLLSVIYSLARSREQAGAISSIIILGLSIIGGSMFPFEKMPTFLQAVGQLTPNHWSIVAYQSVQKAKPLSALILPLSILGGAGLAGIAAALALFQRQLLHRPGK